MERGRGGKLRFGFVILAALLIGSPCAASGPDSTYWTESVFWVINGQGTINSGIAPFFPEPLTATPEGPGYSMHSSISFPLVGPPNMEASVEFMHEGGLEYSYVLAVIDVTFCFRVRQVAEPPTAVSMVPVSIQAQGSVQASGDLPAIANSYFKLTGESGPLLAWDILADNVEEDGQNQTSDSFNNSQELNLPPDQVITGEMRADASTFPIVPSNNTSGSATAFVDPIIEIADALIPGSSVNYRTYFEIELSPGFFVLGSTPARKTTWGRIKKLYEQ